MGQIICYGQVFLDWGMREGGERSPIKKENMKCHAFAAKLGWFRGGLQAKEKKRIITKTKRNKFRTGMSEATKSSDKIWRLARWAKDKSHASRKVPRMPTLCANGVEAKTFEGKIDMLKSYFFPPPSTPDLTDMEQAVYSKKVDCLKNITRKAVCATIKRQHSDKTPDSDGIPNRVLKTLAESLIIWLLPMFQACVDTSYHALTFKTANTITFKKARKSRLHRSKSVSISCAIEHYRKDPGSYSRQKTKSTRRVAELAPRLSVRCASPLFYRISIRNSHRANLHCVEARWKESSIATQFGCS